MLIDKEQYDSEARWENRLDFHNRHPQRVTAEKICLLIGYVLYFVESINRISYYPNLLIAGKIRKI